MTFPDLQIVRLPQPEPVVALDAQNAPTFSPEKIGLSCPHCHSRGVRSQGSRLYLCLNPDCRGSEAGGLGPHALMLVVDAMEGARLVPWQEAIARDRRRKADPRALLRGIAR